ncbi:MULTISPECIES: TonB-dependent receptor domain-containing protein [unclassified Tenacibaculum]|uniref:TonB-dependent receptor n=1 Tax=unclassified Tenacibaculum TaxID=2635139 RepID=UPI001F40F653|nr:MULTISPECIES: TonB-dependent receptor [unclassified Tenacibaculum]MCF2876575.1 TonB-dependent receptor [Tenacibaculum sp. Cn5-1]MCF2936726.1 TonB-dependent receptor [Tenacibaculum sp. Cn5-34]MCG7512950.1 TonB-dependent receptor [Tenacibaculum sp. Cn5-46]
MDLKYILLVLVLTFSSLSYSQIKGTVLDTESSLPISEAVINIKPYNKWTVTDKNGQFNIQVKTLPVTLEFSFLGKKKVSLLVKEFKSDIIIRLADNDLKLDEVIVTAKNKEESTGSNLVLGKQAINLVQAQSVADVMQLIPGNSISESNLHERQLLSLRTAFFSDASRRNVNNGLLTNNDPYLLNNTFGVGYVIDDVPIDNDVNLSGFRGLKFGGFNNITENNTVNMGLDLKNLSLNNIESIDIVQGISSARYGNHTSGLVKINRAHGTAPFSLNTTLRAGSYSVSLSKGYRLPKEKGFLNLGLDYLRSDADPRSAIDKYDRLTFNGSWSYRKPNKTRNLLSFSYAQNINSYNTQETTTSRRKRKNDSRRFRLSNTNTTYFSNFFIDNITSTISLDYSENNSLNSNFTSYGGNPILGATSEGTYEASYTPISYWATEQVDNKPLSFFSRLEAQKVFDFNNTIFKIDLGASFSINKNFGKGNTSSSDEPLIIYSVSSGGSNGFRNINFNDNFPADKRFSTYLTTNINSKIFGKKWVTDLGLRYDNYNKHSILNPRINTKLYLSKKLKFRTGAGLFSKAPSLQSLYPGNLYYDYLIADYRTNSYSLALAHTFVRQFTNENLKPSRTFKYEAGIDFNTKAINTSLTFYYNKLKDGFTNQSNFEIAQLPTYDFTFYPDRAPDYTLSGHKPVLLNYNLPSNALESENYGLELLVNTGKIKEINTSFNLTAAYRNTLNNNPLNSFIVNNDDSSDILIGIHEGRPTRFQKINSSISAIHHISSIGLVITLTAEQFIMAKQSNFGRYIYPIAYYNRNLNYHTIPESEQSDTKYSGVRKLGTNSDSSSNDIDRVYGNYHLRLSKEFDNGLRFSFYAVNFLNHLPKSRKLNSDGSWSFSQLNRPISFGGSIFYKF